MVKIDPNQNQSADQATSTQTNQNNQTETKSGLLTIIGQLLPLAPFAFEQFTGQKVPHMSGTMAEIQLALTQIQTNLQTLANNQQSLSQRLIALESNATHQFTNLISQVQNIQTLKLTHEKERKEIEYNPNKITNQDY
jgi:hypothetical protein